MLVDYMTSRPSLRQLKNAFHLSRTFINHIDDIVFTLNYAFFLVCVFGVQVLPDSPTIAWVAWIV